MKKIETSESPSRYEICSCTECTACAACLNICNHEAISMQEDECGYLYPKIDTSKCVGCGLCRTVCPVLHPLDLQNPQKVYAVVSQNMDEHRTSSSGGAASTIGRYVISQNGILYGCLQKNYKEIKHIRVDRDGDIGLLKGSKYVQSEIELIYRRVRQDLQTGKSVLFVGTPCQIAGLRCFLRKEYPNLYTIDLVCHGVAPQRMLHEDVEMSAVVKGKLKEDIYVNFRWKTNSGIRFGIQLFQNGEKKVLKSIRFPYDSYITAFMTGLSFRENCHKCVYAGVDRVGDITIGDFWGLGAYQKTKIKAKDGVSLLLVNTEKGEKLLQDVKDEFILEERTLKEAVQGNANLRVASVRPQGKDIFKKVLKEKGLNAACRAALPRKQYLRLVIVEELKRFAPLVYVFKKVRLLINQLKQ